MANKENNPYKANRLSLGSKRRHSITMGSFSPKSSLLNSLKIDTSETSPTKSRAKRCRSTSAMIKKKKHKKSVSMHHVQIPATTKRKRARSSSPCKRKQKSSTQSPEKSKDTELGFMDEAFEREEQFQKQLQIKEHEIRLLKEELENEKAQKISKRKSKRLKIRNAECVGHRRSKSQTDEKSDRLRRNLIHLEQENNDLKMEIETLKSKSFDLQMLEESDKAHAEAIRALKKEHAVQLNGLRQCAKCDQNYEVVGTLQEKIEKYAKDASYLRKKVESQSDERAMLEMDNALLTKQCDDIKAQNDELVQQRNKNIEKMEKESNEKIDELKGKNNELLLALESIHTEMDGLKSTNHEYFGQIEKLRMEKEEMEQTMRELKAEMTQATDNEDELKAEYNLLMGNFDCLKAKCDEKDENVRYQNEIITELSNKNEVLLEEKESFKSENEEIRIKYNAMQQRINEKDEEINTEMTKRKEIENEHKKKSELVSKLNADIVLLQNVNKERKLEILSLQNDIKMLKTKNSEINASESTKEVMLEHKLKCAQRDIDALKERLNDRKNDQSEKYDALVDKIQDLEKDLNGEREQKKYWMSQNRLHCERISYLIKTKKAMGNEYALSVKDAMMKIDQLKALYVGTLKQKNVAIKECKETIKDYEDKLIAVTLVHSREMRQFNSEIHR